VKRDCKERLRRSQQAAAQRLRSITFHVSRFTSPRFTRELLWENPLLARFARARLRRQHLIPLAIGVLIAGGWIVKELSLDTARDGVAFRALLVLQGALLFLAGSAQVAAAVGQARESGLLDFHRISPQRPMATTLGFLLGAPVREYLLVAFTLPLWLYLVARGWPRPGGCLVIAGALLLAALLYHAAAALVALLAPRARLAPAAVVAGILILNLAGSGAYGAEAAFTAAPACQQVLSPERIPQAHFYGLSLPQAVLALLHQLPLFLFLMIPVARKMRLGSATLYSKPAAVAFLAAIAVVLLGDAWSASAGARTRAERGYPAPDIPLLLTLYGLAIAALLLSLAVTPGAGRFATGLRRGGIAPWSDLSPNWAPLTAFCVIILLAGAAAGRAPAAGGLPAGRVVSASVAAALAVFWGGCAKQFFDLRFGRRGAAYAGLCTGFVWLFPLLISGLMETRARAGVDARQAVAGISPIFGIILAARAGEPGTGHLGSATALIAGAALAALFAVLRMKSERGMRDEVCAEPGANRQCRRHDRE
jgi:hypothetical protein